MQISVIFVYVYLLLQCVCVIHVFAGYGAAAPNGYGSKGAFGFLFLKLFCKMILTGHLHNLCVFVPLCAGYGAGAGGPTNGGEAKTNKPGTSDKYLVLHHQAHHKSFHRPTEAVEDICYSIVVS